MYQITQITSDPLQQQTLVLPDGSEIFLSLYYVPQQFGWFITELTRNDFILLNRRVCNSPNMLHQFINQIPFGLACYTAGNREPTQQQDFSTGAAKLYILTAAECREYQLFLAGGAP